MSENQVRGIIGAIDLCLNDKEVMEIESALEHEVA